MCSYIPPYIPSHGTALVLTKCDVSTQIVYRIQDKKWTTMFGQIVVSSTIILIDIEVM